MNNFLNHKKFIKNLNHVYKKNIFDDNFENQKINGYFNLNTNSVYQAVPDKTTLAILEAENRNGFDRVLFNQKSMD